MPIISSLENLHRMIIDVISALVNNFTAVQVYVWQNWSHGVNPPPWVYPVSPVFLEDRGRCTIPTRRVDKERTEQISTCLYLFDMLSAKAEYTMPIMSNLENIHRIMTGVIRTLVDNFTAVLVHVWQSRSHGVNTPVGLPRESCFPGR